MGRDREKWGGIGRSGEGQGEVGRTGGGGKGQQGEVESSED